MPQSKKLHRIPPAILQRSRDFRHPLTPTEAKVWQAVRGRRIGLKNRRQHPIERFTVDFYCAEANLVIEIDGDSHVPEDQAAYDAERTRWLEERGYRVIRFTAGQVEEDLAGVVEAEFALPGESALECREGPPGRRVPVPHNGSSRLHEPRGRSAAER